MASRRLQGVKEKPYCNDDDQLTDIDFELSVGIESQVWWWIVWKVPEWGLHSPALTLEGIPSGRAIYRLISWVFGIVIGHVSPEPISNLQLHTNRKPCRVFHSIIGAAVAVAVIAPNNHHDVEDFRFR